MAKGTQQTLNVDADPRLRTGDAVRVVASELQPGTA